MTNPESQINSNFQAEMTTSSLSLCRRGMSEEFGVLNFVIGAYL
jgi:hypothetical protein